MRQNRFAAAVLFAGGIFLAGSAPVAGSPGPAGQAVTPPAAQRLDDLPLVEVPAPGGGRGLLAVLLTGDGGWAVADKGLSKDLAAAGIPVVGFNSLKYFWKQRTPEEAAADLQRVLEYYLPAWGKKQAILIGYSLGADVLPFMMNRLSGDIQAEVRMVVLMSASRSAEFEFHVLDWLGRPGGKQSLPTVPEIGRIRAGVVILCVHGEKDSGAICGEFDPGRVRSAAIPGGHRVGGGYGPVAAAILAALDER